ncbi:bile acid:sodium symporter family protein [Antrihabitans sp. YC2-6]|uniref:bile acid:sodium symporter family protein n=1 Tax=Antrihabitans sp. YC2-6 TaxID=2799498 RepID=UPI0018F38405|nr:bile acid:sodium symporter family protein [Antrihabitans sp. YC2-6]MBJ8347676.1 bile acid:sodium symporter [Antrihabitans sp. YC2-6]
MRFLSKVPIDSFVLSIIGVAVLASVLPARGRGETVVDVATTVAIFLLFLLYGARLSPREALDGLKHWRLHSVVLATTFVLFPLIGLAARILVPHVLTDELYTGVLFMCLVPSTVQSSIVFTSMAKGNVAGAVVSASVSNIVGVFLTPLLVILLMNTTGEAKVDPSSVVNIVAQLLLPFVLGQLLRPLVKDWVTKYARPTKIVDRGSILLVVYGAFSAGVRDGIWQTLALWRIAALVLTCCAILAVILGLTAVLGRVLGFAREDRVVIVFAGSKKSLASGLPMAAVLFAGQSVGLIVLPLMIFHQVQLIVCAFLAQRWAKRVQAAPSVQLPS